MEQGLNYVIKHNLTARECKIILALVGEELTIKEIAEEIKLNLSNVQSIVSTLRLKGVIEVSGTDKKFYKYKLI